LHIKGSGEKRKPQIHLSIKTYLFGNIPVGKTREKKIKVQNTGTGELLINDIAFEYPYQENFIFKNFTLPLSIAPLGMKELIMEFKPTAVQSYKTKVYLHSNSVKDSVFQLQFMGTGLKPTSVEEYLQDELITIYPNPATESINITLNPIAHITSIHITDILGRIISLNDTLNNLGTGTIKCDTRHLKPGVYFVVIGTDNKNKTYPFIIE
jgi:hypothetical protein